MTQKQRVLLYLKTQGSVCVGNVPLDVGYTLRNRVGELIREGHRIEKQRCPWHQHRAPVMAYTLIVDPVQAEIAL
jgi:hypothetical protein